MMNNKLQVKAPFAAERVETKMEALTNNSLTCRSCQKCKHAYEEPQKVWSHDWNTEFRDESI